MRLLLVLLWLLQDVRSGVKERRLDRVIKQSSVLDFDQLINDQYEHPDNDPFPHTLPLMNAIESGHRQFVVASDSDSTIGVDGVVDIDIGVDATYSSRQRFVLHESRKYISLDLPEHINAVQAIQAQSEDIHYCIDRNVSISGKLAVGDYLVASDSDSGARARRQNETPQNTLWELAYGPSNKGLILSRVVTRVDALSSVDSIVGSDSGDDDGRQCYAVGSRHVHPLKLIDSFHVDMKSRPKRSTTYFAPGPGASGAVNDAYVRELHIQDEASAARLAEGSKESRLLGYVAKLNPADNSSIFSCVQGHRSPGPGHLQPIASEPVVPTGIFHDDAQQGISYYYYYYQGKAAAVPPNVTHIPQFQGGFAFNKVAGCVNVNHTNAPVYNFNHDPSSVSYAVCVFSVAAIDLT